MKPERSWAEKLAVVRRFEDSGKTREAFCRALGLAPTTLDGWRQRARQRARSVAVEIAGGGGGNAAVVIVLVNGRRIEVGPGFDSETLATALAVAERG